MKKIGIGSQFTRGSLVCTVRFIENDGVLIEIAGRLEKFSFKETESLFGYTCH